MYQIYFLSIVTNLLSGLILARDSIGGSLRIEAMLSKDLTEKAGFCRGLGVLTLVVGILKLLSVTAGDVLIVGDIIPAMAGMAGGFSLASPYFRDPAVDSSPLFDNLDIVFSHNRNLWGMLSLLAAVLHFIFPQVLFL